MTGKRDRTGEAESALGSPLWAGLFASLLFARWLAPTESGEQGETLLLASVSIVAGVAFLYVRWRSGQPLCFGGADVAVAAVCGSQALSGLVTLVRPADASNAAVLIVEWLAVGVVALAIRQVCIAGERAWFMRAMVALFVALSLYGIWQHYVWYPSLAAEYTAYEQLADARDDGALSASGEVELRRLISRLGPDAANADAERRAALRQRVVFSTEPIGFFALANTFAIGPLVACIVLVAVGMAELNARTVRWTRIAPVVAALGVTLTALLLTKSRTAIVGGVTAAAVTAAILALRRRRDRNRPTDAATKPVKTPRRIVVVGLIAGSLTLLVGALLLLGGLDAEVLTEAPKSLRYRLEYWAATAELIAKSPLLGGGLGQFKSAYLEYKLAGASEEISDPHNWVLESWATGGLLGVLAAVLGVGGTLLAAGRLLLTSPRRTEDVSAAVFPSNRATAVAFGLTLLWGVVLNAALDPLFLVIAAAAAGTLVPVDLSASRGRVAAFAAAVAISVHLLGAGGFGMPAIATTWLVLLTIALPRDHVRSILPRGLIVFASLTLLAIAFFAGPEFAERSAYETVERRLSQGRSAAAALQEAAEANPRSPQPWFDLARLPDEPLEVRRNAVAEAIARDPRRPANRILAAELAVEAGDGESATANAVAAIDRYPNSAVTWALLAEVSDGVQQMAAAKRAIELDEAMRRAGHADKLLPKAERDRLDAIAADAVTQAEVDKR